MTAAGEDRIRRTLTYSVLDGVGYSVMVGAGESYFIPYAIFLGAPNLILGLLVAFPIFLGSLSQLFSEKLLRVLGSRRRLIGFAGLLQALTFVPVISVPFLPAYSSQILLFSVCLYWIFGLVLGPAWSSLLGDLVEERRRGEYFGRRNRYSQISVFFSLLAAGFILFSFKRQGLEYSGFVVTFGVSALARVVSSIFLLLHHEPPMASPPHGRTISMVVETLRHRDHRVLILYLTLMNFGVYLSAPFFSAYMLRSPSQHGLGWSYATFTAITAIAMLFKFLFLPLWGKASDRFGTRKCLALAAAMVCLLPLFWLTPSSNPALHLAMICFTQALGGFSWSGYELCSFNFLLDSASATQRPRLVATLNIVNGAMVFLGSSAGALAVSAAASWVNPFLMVFLLSALARGAVSAAFLPRVREVRQVESISYRSLFFRVSGVRANLGAGMRFFLFPGKRGAANGEGQGERNGEERKECAGAARDAAGGNGR